MLCKYDEVGVTYSMKLLNSLRPSQYKKKKHIANVREKFHHECGLHRRWVNGRPFPTTCLGYIQAPD